MRIRCDLVDTSDALRLAFGAAVFAERPRASGRQEMDCAALGALIEGAADPAHADQAHPVERVAAAARLER